VSHLRPGTLACPWAQAEVAPWRPARPAGALGRLCPAHLAIRL